MNMLMFLAIIIGAVSLWELLEGIGLVGWGLVEIIKQMFCRG